MPVSMIEDGKYLIGTRVVSVNIDNTNSVMVRVGGGYRTFQQYIKCEEAELRRLQMKIEQTGLTRDQLVEQMVKTARHKESHM